MFVQLEEPKPMIFQINLKRPPMTFLKIFA